MPQIDGVRIRDLARKTGLRRSRASVANIQGKLVKFTPVSAPPGKSPEDFERNGAVIGLLETEVDGDEVSVRRGAYHVWAVKEPSEGWVAYLVDKQGNVHAKSARAGHARYKGTGKGYGWRAPKAFAGSLGWYFCVIEWGDFKFLCFYF